MNGARGLMLGLTLSVVSWTGCGGESKGGNVVLPSTCIDFAAASLPVAGAVTTEEAASSCESVTLDVVVSDIDDLFAASFTVNFDPTVVDYEGLQTVGSVLASDGTPIEVLEQDHGGSVTIGLSRLGAATGVDVQGTRTLITLAFGKVMDSDTSDLGFSNATLMGSETPPVAKPAIQWNGGTLIVE